MSNSVIPCTYERHVYIIIIPPLYWAMVVIICLVLLWPVHAINLCCTIVGPSYTMSAQHKSNIGSESFTCVVVDLLLLRQIYQQNVQSDDQITTTLCLMLGQHLRLWITMNPELGHRSYWFAVSVSTKHWPNIGLTMVHRLRHRPNIMKTLGRCRPILFTL